MPGKSGPMVDWCRGSVKSDSKKVDDVSKDGIKIFQNQVSSERCFISLQALNASMDAHRLDSRLAMLSKFFKTTSCHGFSSIHSSKSIKLKVFRILVLLLSFSLLFCLLFRIIWRFANNPTVTSIETKMWELMEIPKVLVCQGRFLRLSFLKQKNISERLADYIQEALQLPGRNRLWFSPEEEDEIYPQYKRLLEAYPNKDLRELLFEAGPNCSTMFIKGTDAHRDYDAFDCCQNLLEERIDRMRGKCFLFNSLRPQYHPGFRGLGVRVRLNPDDYLPPSPSIDDMMGLIVKIHPRYNPFEMTEVKIPLGNHASFELEKEVTVLSNSPFKTVCNESTEMQDKSELWCREECCLEKYVDVYDCYDLTDLSALNGRFFGTCSTRGFTRKTRVLWRGKLSRRALNQVSPSLALSARIFLKIRF